MRDLLVKGGIGREMADQFGLRFRLPHKSQGFFYMPHICDMGKTALLPLRRKACCGFLRLKNPTASAGFEPAILDTRLPKPLHITGTIDRTLKTVLSPKNTRLKIYNILALPTLLNDVKPGQLKNRIYPG
jgi:hypothetical protein